MDDVSYTKKLKKKNNAALPLFKVNTAIPFFSVKAVLYEELCVLKTRVFKTAQKKTKLPGWGN